MTISDHKDLYSRFLKGHSGKLHFAAHSHHFWPDVSREAHLKYWDDCAQASDEKWSKIFGEVIPLAQSHVARILNLSHKEQIVFAPNTHELASRVLSLFTGKSEVSVLTTSSEFHSWKRQLQRLAEIPQFKVSLIDTDHLIEKRADFFHRLKNELAKGPDLFFISQVFFDSGIALSVEELCELSQNCLPKTIMVIDGYHGFAAIPTDLSRLEGKVFYLAGGYKYAQAGEGAAFLVVPKGTWRPAYTGWFAEFGDLKKPPGTEVGYTQDAMAFMGATQDFSGLYRLNAVWNEFQERKLSVETIHSFVLTLQKHFIASLPKNFCKVFDLTPLYHPDLTYHGHFLTFEAFTEETADKALTRLKERAVLIDRRGRRIRFGFGLYHTLDDVDQLLSCLKIVAETHP